MGRDDATIAEIGPPSFTVQYCTVVPHKSSIIGGHSSPALFAVKGTKTGWLGGSSTVIRVGPA
ncbi:hypothetical protein ACLOJK_009824 [Asimina triloba]